MLFKAILYWMYNCLSFKKLEIRALRDSLEDHFKSGRGVHRQIVVIVLLIVSLAIIFKAIIDNSNFTT